MEKVLRKNLKVLAKILELLGLVLEKFRAMNKYESTIKKKVKLSDHMVACPTSYFNKLHKQITQTKHMRKQVLTFRTIFVSDFRNFDYTYKIHGIFAFVFLQLQCVNMLLY